MTNAPIEKPCQRWKVERAVLVAPCLAPKEGTVQPARASAANGSATIPRTRRHRWDGFVTP